MGKEEEAAVAKLSQVLSIEPSKEIKFRGDFREVVSVDLSLKNTTNRRLCFKVKTNYPHRYFVRPNGGLIEPSEQQIVTIMLQPLEIIEDELKLHKFMVQAIFAPDGPINGLEKLWKETRQENIMDTKIRCTFEQIQIQSANEEKPRYRGSRGGEINGTATEERQEVSLKSKNEDHKDTESSSSSTALLIILLILFGLIVFLYLKMK